MLIDAARQTFDMMEISNRRFMYHTDTCELILGDQAAIKGDSFGSHAEDHGNSGVYEPFDTFIRGWIGTGGPYTHGVIHFAPPISEKNADIFTDAYNTLQMFRENGADADTVVRGFCGAWEQPLSNILPGFQVETKESEGLKMSMNAMEETYEPVELLNKPALFTNGRIDLATLPPGLFAYDLREGDNGRASTVENSVAVNHFGTVITAEPVDFKKKDYRALTDRNGGLNFAADHDCTTVAGFRQYAEQKRALEEARDAGAGRRPSALGKLDAAKQAVKLSAPKEPGKKKNIEME
jgi:hypothetical protein